MTEMPRLPVVALLASAGGLAPMASVLHHNGVSGDAFDAEGTGG